MDRWPSSVDHSRPCCSDVLNKLINCETASRKLIGANQTEKRVEASLDPALAARHVLGTEENLYGSLELYNGNGIERF